MHLNKERGPSIGTCNTDIMNTKVMKISNSSPNRERGGGRMKTIQLRIHEPCNTPVPVNAVDAPVHVQLLLLI